MVKLERLKIEKYRNVKPGTELHFRDSLNVLLGRNGTGKTTLLNLIVQLLRWDFSKLRDEEVRLEYDLKAPEVALTVRIRSEPVEQPVVCGQALPGEFLAMEMLHGGPRHATSLEIDIVRPDSKPWSVRVEGASLVVTSEENIVHQSVTEQPVLGEGSLAALVRALGSTSSPKLVQALGMSLPLFSKGLLFHLMRFDESLGYLEQMVERAPISVLKLVQGGGEYSAITLGPSSFAQRLGEALNQDPECDDLRIDSRERGQEFLQRLAELMGFESAQVRFQRTARGPVGQHIIQLDFGNIQFYFTRRDGSIIHHSLLSYGQKRLLAFFYYLASNSVCVVADELVNGMHHEWIGACLDELGERQAFLTSQNPLLMDYLVFESAEEVRSSFVLCHLESHEERDQMVWENMSPEEAASFFDAYQVATRHVGELLRLRGLW
jgi:ABC-type cobalamin/Fe3+-siderophores transport system ATPase subunit